MLTCTPNVTLHFKDYVSNLRKCNFARLLLLSQLAHLKNVLKLFCTPNVGLHDQCRDNS